MNKKTENYVKMYKELKKQQSVLNKKAQKLEQFVEAFEDKKSDFVSSSPDGRKIKIPKEKAYEGQDFGNNALKQEITTQLMANAIKICMIRIAALECAKKPSKRGKTKGFLNNQIYVETIKSKLIDTYNYLLTTGAIDEIYISEHEMIPHKLSEEAQSYLKVDEHTINNIIANIELEMSPREVRRMSR